MSEVKISFVVVNFGYSRTLRICLDSILDQALPPDQVEIVVVDNTIDNETAANVREMCRIIDPKIRYEWTAGRTVILDPYIRHKRCLYTATEIGAALATGEWMVFPNADSYYPSVFAPRMLAASEGADFVYSNLVLGRPDWPYHAGSTEPSVCKIDKTCFMVRREWFQGFKKKWSHYEVADGLMVNDLVERGARCTKVEQVLCVHN